MPQYLSGGDTGLVSVEDSVMVYAARSLLLVFLQCEVLVHIIEAGDREGLATVGKGQTPVERRGSDRAAEGHVTQECGTMPGRDLTEFHIVLLNPCRKGNDARLQR
eukprot:6893118-Heterocapsa_arctica.AAC.1